MPRLGLGLGLNLPRPIFLGGGSPSVPVGALATYTAYSPSNFTLVTGNKVNVWQDETTNGNDLTQGTSGNQPVLVEDNTVTQFTANNQPTYNQVGGVDVMEFDVNDFLRGLSRKSGDVCFEIVISFPIAPTSNKQFLRGENDSDAYMLYDGTEFRVAGNGRTTVLVFSYTTLPNTIYKINLERSGDNVELLVNDVSLGVQTTNEDFLFDIIGYGSFSQSIDGFIYSFKQWNSADSSGAPDFTLTPDPTAMRTSANVNPVLGEDVAKWYADEWSGYRDNHVLFDPVKYMEGLPTQASDFTYIFKYQDDDQATAGAIVSSNIDSSGISNVDGDTTELIAGDATSYSFDNTGATSYRMVAYLKSGNDVYNVTDYVTTPTQDATGKAFNLTSLGKATSGKDMKIKEFYLYDRELVGTDLDYFFYLRSETGEILLPPLLPS